MLFLRDDHPSVEIAFETDVAVVPVEDRNDVVQHDVTLDFARIFSVEVPGFENVLDFPCVRIIHVEVVVADCVFAYSLI